MKNLWIVLGVVAALLAVLLFLPEPLDDSTADDPTTAVAAMDGEGEADRSDAPGTNATAIVGVRLFDGERVIEDATVLLTDGRVAQAGPRVSVIVPDHATTVDGAGRTALPGLIDAHVHAFGRAQVDAARFGVTTLLDMFRTPDDFDRQHAQREGREPVGQADLYSAGYLATAEGGHGTQYGIDVPLPESPEGAAAWVDDRLAEGSDWIKIVVEGGEGWGGDIPSLDADTVAAVVDAAHARGVLALAHVGSLAEAELAVAAGVDGLVHLFGDREVDAATAAAWAKRGLFVIPTTPVLAGAYGQPGLDRLDRFEAIEDQLSAEQRRSLAGSFPNSQNRTAMWPRVEASIRTLHAAGVPLLAGSDAPNPGTAHGISLLDAVIRLHQAGLSPIEAMKSATSTTASVFTMLADDDPRGCLRPGCRADLLLVYGNPLDDPTDLLRIAEVWKNGAIVERALPAAAAPAESSGPAAAADLLADLTHWMPAADDYMGGASNASIELVDGALRVDGTLRPGFAFPYAGGMWSAADIPMQAVDRRGWTSLTLSVSGEVDLLRVMFFSGNSPQPVWRDVGPGEDIRIELDELDGVDLSAFQALGVFAAGEPGDFDFTIERARFE
ncbi:amidohydrolase family protein [Halomonas denitrificans]|nr:amidohydrolase family protein [Halomonas denitrificans]